MNISIRFGSKEEAKLKEKRKINKRKPKKNTREGEDTAQTYDGCKEFKNTSFMNENCHINIGTVRNNTREKLKRKRKEIA
jgi:hypothetical protein